MSDTPEKTEEVVKETKRLTKSQVVNAVKRKLRLAEVSYLYVTAGLKEFTITQAGEHDSAEALAALMIEEGLFDYDGDELTEEVTVVKTYDQFNVCLSTITTLSREFAKFQSAEPAEDEQEELDLID